MLMLTRGSIWSATVTHFQLANLEMLLELAPFFLGGLAVFGFRANGSPLIEERPVGADEVVLEDGEVCLSCGERSMAEQTSGNVDRQSAGNGFRGKNSVASSSVELLQAEWDGAGLVSGPFDLLPGWVVQ